MAFGASAGGLEAFQEILQTLPDDTGLAFAFIQHLDPKHVSILGELLSRCTRMPVVQVKHRMPIEANQVSVIPPNVGMRLSMNRLLLTERSGAAPRIWPAVSDTLWALDCGTKRRNAGHSSWWWLPPAAEAV